jgi:GGDEF domain-containing protein
VILLGLLCAFGLGLTLAIGPMPDLAEDCWRDLQVSWYQYRLNSGSAGTIYIMVAGFLLGQGLFLSCRQLWRGLLRSVRGRFAMIDAARDLATTLPSKFALRYFLDRSIGWARGDPSTRHVSLALVRLRGLGRVNKLSGVLQGTELLRTLAREVLDASIPPTIMGVRRWWSRWRLRPRVILYSGSPPSRCPSRWSGSTFAIAFRGVDARKAYFVVRDLTSALQELARTLQPKAEMSAIGALALLGGTATSNDLGQGAETALRAASEPGTVVVAHEPNDGGTAMLDEFKDLQRVLIEVKSDSGVVVEEEPEGPSVGARVGRWLKGWGVALACLGAVPIVVMIGNQGGGPKLIYPWPENLKAVPTLDAAGVRSVRVLRSEARAQSDGVWRVDEARLVQLELNANHPSVGFAQVHLTITNRSSVAQHLTIFDITAIDEYGRVLRVDPKGSLRFERALGARTLGPGERWSGWLSFIRRDALVKSLIVQPARGSRLYLPFAS